MTEERTRIAARTGTVLALLAMVLLMSGCAKNGRPIRLLFIGNSHTYVHDVPSLVRNLAESEGFACDTKIAAKSDYYLRDHLSDSETVRTLEKGGFDFVIFQEHAVPFPDRSEYEESVKGLMELVPDSRCRFILLECWARKGHGKTQKKMCRVNETVAENTGAVLAEVGKIWKETLDADPDAGLYGGDNEHASAKGADLTARILWDTIRQEWEKGQ